jgi:hypothetical protein
VGDETTDGETGNKYLARSFLLPLLMGIAYTVLLFCEKIHGEREMALIGLVMLSFAGIFNVSEAFKTWATLRYPPQKPQQ